MASIDYRTRAGLAELQQAHDALVGELQENGVSEGSLGRVWTAIRRYAEAKTELAVVEIDRRQGIARRTEDNNG